MSLLSLLLLIVVKACFTLSVISGISFVMALALKKKSWQDTTLVVSVNSVVFTCLAFFVFMLSELGCL